VRALVSTVVVGQLLVLGLWFAGTAAAPELLPEQPALLTIAVQVGFVVGTLGFAFLNVADRFPPERVFLASSIVGAVANGALVWVDGAPTLVALRFVTGLSLAGVYPVGMKILASWTPDLGHSLGWLIAALTLGSGSPYLVRALGLPWQTVLLTASVGALVGGALVGVMVRAGPLLPARSPFDATAFARAFKKPAFRRSALGYFGHMWELYAFWGLVALFLAASPTLPDAPLVAGLTFFVFLAGALGAVGGGLLSRRVGEARVALGALLLSATCCLLAPWAWAAPLPLLAIFLGVWGAAVIADSAQFSALSARAAPRGYVGTSLTLQNTIGFAITFVSLGVVPLVAETFGWRWAFLALVPGPLLGALAIAPLARDARPAVHDAEAREDAA
jgi:MFS family permease